MTKLEQALLAGAKAAQKEYIKLTGGWWLSHGPESFIQHSVAISLGKQGFPVYPEASPKKIMNDREAIQRGRPPKNLGQRFDVVVWDKTTDRVRAIIEIKRAWNFKDLSGDQEKIMKFLQRHEFVRSGYLLAYTEAKGAKRADTLAGRFSYWAAELECALVNSHIDAQGDGVWAWAIGLFRLL